MPRLSSTIAHKIYTQASRPGYLLFKGALGNVEDTQRRLLNQMLLAAEKTAFGREHKLHGGITWEQLRRRLPVTEYADWDKWITQQRQSQEPVLCAGCDRYQPTSGSTARIKWIPYSRTFLKQIDQAISPWIFDLYSQTPGIQKGRHYWSISWVPTELRAKISNNVNDDLKILPWWKRSFLGVTMAVPEEVSQTASSEATIFSSLCYLAAESHLTLMSVWSPTFTINQLEELSRCKEEVAEVLSKGRWSKGWSKILNHLPAPLNPGAAALLKEWNGEVGVEFFANLWPELKIISCWDTATSSIWAQKLRQVFPRVSFQGKGLLATEGVVTIPFANQYPLAIRSHFFEFKDLETERVFPAWKIKKGQVLQPILTTGSGFFRYALRDRVKVTGFIKECPSFEFLGRLDGIDMVGEKVSPELAQNILLYTAKNFAVNPTTLLAVRQTEAGQRKPHYLLLCEGKAEDARALLIAQEVERILHENFHYKLARELNQLDAACCLVTPNAREIYASRGLIRGMILGTMKIEPVTLWDSPLPAQLQGVSSEPPRPTAKNSASRRAADSSRELSP